MDSVHADVDTLAENDKALLDHINEVSKAVQSTERDGIETPIGGANDMVFEHKQQNNPNDVDDVSWVQIMEEADDQNISAAATNVTSDCDGVRLVTVSAPAEEFLKGAFVELSNPDKKSLRNQFTAPNLPLTLSPKFDKVWEAECSKGVKSLDQRLSWGQAFFLDAAGPWVEVLEAIYTGQKLAVEGVEERVKAALSLLGSASSQLSALRRLKVIEEYDKDPMTFCQSFKNY